MVRRGFGRIVLMSSVAGQATMPNIAAYATAKGAIAAFARALAVEYGGSGITCNALAPGFVRTDFTQGLQDNPQFQSFLSTAVPAGRWAEPDDIAPAVVYHWPRRARPSSTARCWRSTAACWRACRGGRHERTKRAVRPGLVKRFGGFRAVDGVSLALREGSIHALIGPNGAGKTTCFNLLTKFLSPDEGEIRYRGRDITSLAPEQIARLGIVRSFQISAVFLGLTVLQNMRVALMRQHGDGMRFWRSRRSVDRFNARALELLAAVGLDDQADTIAALLPYGRKRALDRHDAGAGPGDHAAGRAHGRTGAGGRGAHRGADPARVGQAQHPHGGTQPVRGRGPVRHHHRAGARRRAGPGRLRRRVARRARHHRLHGRAEEAH